MAKVKLLITKVHRHFTPDEAQCIYEILSQTNIKIKLREITKNASAIEIIHIENIEKVKLKKELKEIMATIYKTDDSWKELTQRQKKTDLKNHQLTDYEKILIANA